MSKLMFLNSDPRSRSLTQQHFREQVNINTIMRKARKTGVMPQFSGDCYYGDVSQIVDYKDCLDKVNKIGDLFMGMPVEVRNKFKNNPAEIIDFLADEKNEDEARKLGLLRPLTAEEVEAKKVVEAEEPPPVES
jgi:phage internal scaffolding protein